MLWAVDFLAVPAFTDEKTAKQHCGLSKLTSQAKNGWIFIIFFSRILCTFMPIIRDKYTPIAVTFWYTEKDTLFSLFIVVINL